LLHFNCSIGPQCGTEVNPAFGKGGFQEYPRLSYYNWNIDEAAVLVQILDPRRDLISTAEFRLHGFLSIMKLGAPFDYLGFPGVAHSCFMNGNSRKVGENAAVGRMMQFLYNS
jgi:hypothetical protein